MRTKWRHSAGGVVASIILGSVGLVFGITTTATAATRAPALNSASVAANYIYNDSLGDTNEGLTLNADGTLVFASGCSGLWSVQGTTVSMSINANCGTGNNWVFIAQVNSHGFASAAKPGRIETAEFGAATWHATKATAGPRSPSSYRAQRAGAGRVATVNGSVARSYTYHQTSGTLGLTLNTNHTLLFSSGCTGLWVTQTAHVAMEIDSNCIGETWVFIAPVTTHGFASAAKPGNYTESVGGPPVNGHWWAVKA
jgi:hypothetical protein